MTPETTSWRGALRSLIIEPPPLVGAYTVVPGTAMELVQEGPILYATMTDPAIGVLPAALIAASLSGVFSVELQAIWTPPNNQQFPAVGVLVSTGTSAGVSQVYTFQIYQNGMILGLVDAQWTLGGGRGPIGIGLEFGGAPVVIGDATVRLRLLSDGVLLHYQHSADGIEWYDKASAALPGALTHYGFSIGGSPSNGPGLAKGRILKHKYSATVPQGVISAASGAGVPIQCTCAGHGLRSGDMVAIHGAVGNTAMNTVVGPAYNSGTWWIKVIDPNIFLLLSSVGNGTYTPGSATFYRTNR